MGERVTDQTQLRNAALIIAEHVGLSLSEGPTVGKLGISADPDRRRYVTAKSWMRAIAAMRRAFDDGGFINPPWNIMLDLYVSRHEGQPVTVSGASLASGAPATTGLRYVCYLQEAGLIERKPHQKDGRVVLIQLTDKGLDKIEEVLNATNDGNERLGISHLQLVK